MALSDSTRAIGAVTRLLQDHLIRRSFSVSVGKPEEALARDGGAKLNLFLYETVFDASLKNVSLEPGRAAPLWLVLKYLLTAFDDQDKSDSSAAHELLGRGMAALHELNFLGLDDATAADVRTALEHNPEALKITFDESTVDLLSKMMQGNEERYRLSVAFQARPVMIAPSQEPASALLVGIDYSQDPPETIGAQGERITIATSLRPRIDSIAPARLHAGDSLTLIGEGLEDLELDCLLDDVALQVDSRSPDRLVARVAAILPPDAPPNAEDALAAGTVISAGQRRVRVRKIVDDHDRSSNRLAARLLPSVDDAVLAAGTLKVTGKLLGTARDHIVVQLLDVADESVARMLEGAVPGAGQKTLEVEVNPAGAAALAAGTYRVIVMVNGQRALRSPEITVP